MGWKNWSMWLKGGLIISILDIILVLFAIVSSHPFEAQLLALSIIQFPFFFLFHSFVPYSTQNIYILALGGLLIWFIIGSFIGWIIGKFKS